MPAGSGRIGVGIRAVRVELAFDEVKGLLTIDGSVGLMMVCIVTGAAIRILSIAVVLHLGAGCAGITARTSSKLIVLATWHCHARGLSTYTLGSAGADIVRQAGNIAGVAHEDDRLDLVESTSRDGRGRGGDAGARIRTAADSVVHDLAALGIPNKDNLGVGAPLIEAVDRVGHGRGALGS